jgi:hypothetical protein
MVLFRWKWNITLVVAAHAVRPGLRHKARYYCEAGSIRPVCGERRPAAIDGKTQSTLRKIARHLPRAFELAWKKTPRSLIDRGAAVGI